MKKTILIVLFEVLAMLSNVAKAELKVLFIGNSYTRYASVMINNLVHSSPYSDCTIEYIAPDSYMLQQHLSNNTTISNIRNGKWDFVVLQEQSQLPTVPDRSNEFYDAVAQLSNIIKESGAQAVLYMTWGRRDIDSMLPEINPNYETMQSNLVEAYKKAAHDSDALIAPVGLVWRNVRKDNPQLGYELYLSDGSHPSNKGTFLIACVFYATLFDADPTQLEFTGSLTAEEATYFKRQVKKVYIPDVDFTGDGIVDKDDMCIMVDHWGEDYSLCDIGPMPWGDGVVDTQDLIVLSEYLFEDINDSTLAAHWAFDEIEGMVVADSAGDNDGYAFGDPVWQPDGGLINGALQLDGIDDYVETGTPPNPADGPLSVLAWVKGGEPGQVIVSQQDAANWLMVDAEGDLMTELKSGARSSGPLQSQAIITDGEWHRIGLVWDGSNRILYADGIAVAQDTQKAIEVSISGLYIGCGKGMEAGRFFSGLIDDVRIYNRAVMP